MRIKLLVALTAVFLSGHTFAQCPIPLEKLDVQITMFPLKYEYGYTSHQIQTIQQQKSFNLLGLYTAHKQVNIRPYAESVAINNSNSCASVTNLSIIVAIAPVIYISKEAQRYKCTQERVIQHELLHHQFEINVALKAKPIVEHFGKKHFYQSFMAKNQNEIRNHLNIKTHALIGDIQKYLKDTTKYLHAQIDTPANYNKESEYCSNEENASISGLLNIQNHMTTLK